MTKRYQWILMTKPYVKNNDLVVPFDSDRKYWWWSGGQSCAETLKELRHTQCIPKYTPQLTGMELGGSVVRDLPGMGIEELEGVWEKDHGTKASEKKELLEKSLMTLA
jgi:hypothetical protein